MNFASKIKVIIVLALSTLFCFDVSAQKFYAQVNAKVVQVGQMFECAFIMSASSLSQAEFTAPNFKDFEVASGPNQSSIRQNVNGQVSESLTLSYLLIPKKEGKLVIGAATMSMGGNKLASTPITVEATKGTPQANQVAAASNGKPDGSEVFIKTTLSKSKCYLGEQIMISQKVYSRHQIIAFQKFSPPTYESFWSQTLPSTSGNQTAVENLDGVNYYTFEIFRNIASPNKSGKISLIPIEGEVVIRKQTNAKPRNIFEQFFGANGFEDIAVKATSRVVTLDVLDLPAEGRPANFNGAVGNFTYKLETSRQSLKANDAFNLKVTISGKGNIKLIDAPKLDLPESFETYEPKMSEGANSRTYDYLIIPRQEGEYELSNLDFSYFDLDSKKYVTIPSPNITIKVLAPDPNSAGAQVYSPQNNVKETENDIRYIKKGNFSLTRSSTEFFNSSTHILLLTTPFLALILGLMFRSNYIKSNSDMVAVKERKAVKVAKKQLVKADKLMQANNKDEFYTEILMAINNYLSNKLNIPLADVSKENVKNTLTAKKVAPEKIEKLMKTIETSEYAKYAPGAVSGNLKEVYDDTINLITGIEQDLNIKKA
ncbi:MAG: protein BatD [Sphingobacteriaceae bacterium]|nr:protein BatD [Sphingobacteriaceae bacterium]